MTAEQIPVLKIGPVLFASIQTELHDRTAEDLQMSIMEKIHATGASAVMIDITALQVVDSFIGRVLSETARMAQTMSARIVLVGMRPAVTMTLLEMGLHIPGAEMAIDVEMGLKKIGYSIVSLDEDDQKGHGS